MTDIENIFPEWEQIPESAHMQFPVTQTEYLIRGEIKHWPGEFQDVLSPVYFNKGEGNTNIIGSYPMLEPEQALEALDAAVDAFGNGRGQWPSMSIEERIACVRKFVFMMKEKRGEIVKLLMWEIGKNQKSSEKEFDRTVEYILDTIEALKELDRASSRFVISQQIISQIRRAPLGTVLCMGPFNYPLNETFTTLIPALIMGNTIVFKPPKLGVLLHKPLLEAFRDAFPVGVVNTVYGDGAKLIGPIMESGKVDVLAFIGSDRVADILKKQHPKPHRMRSVLGLGAKNPAIVLPDSDLDLAVKECVLGSLSYNGQRCTAIKIIFVHEDIVNEFNKKFIDAVSKLKSGMPWNEGAQITPLPEQNKTQWLNDFVEDAKANGAEVINDNGGVYNKSYFTPAVLYPVNDKMKIYHEEQFGPVVPILSFKDISEPLDYVVNSRYGQQTAIFGKNPDEIATLTDTLVNQVCRVNINSQCQRGPDTFPFTGRKDSAEGTLSVSDALRVFTIRTLVAAKDTDLNKEIITSIVKEQKSTFLSTDFIF